jgi:hypothetical protein
VDEGRSKPRFRIQEAILILRQGKSHPHWREAAWHLMEYAGKDTQLLLEAQRDLIESVQKDTASYWPKKALIVGLAFVSLTLISILVWQFIEHLKWLC